MKKIAIISFITLVVVSCGTHHLENNTEIKGKIDADGNLIGVVSKKDFLKKPFSDWFEKKYEDYNVSTEDATKLKGLLKGVKIKAFMGTWCGDSRREIPRLYKLLDNADFNYKNLELIAVDRQKKTPENLQQGYDIHHVPTFIFYKNDNDKEIEIGRFVEGKVKGGTTTKDIIKILSEDKTYKPRYSD